MNAIRHNRIGVTIQEDGSIDIVVPKGMAEEFKKLVSRATNTWPDQHVEIRDFADRLRNMEDIVGPCMKHELYGYPVYENKAIPPDTVIISIEGGGASNMGSSIVSTHWDIPSEDKYELAKKE